MHDDESKLKTVLHHHTTHVGIVDPIISSRCCLILAEIISSWQRISMVTMHCITYPFISLITIRTLTKSNYFLKLVMPMYSCE